MIVWTLIIFSCIKSLESLGRNRKQNSHCITVDRFHCVRGLNYAPHDVELHTIQAFWLCGLVCRSELHLSKSKNLFVWNGHFQSKWIAYTMKTRTIITFSQIMMVFSREEKRLHHVPNQHFTINISIDSRRLHIKIILNLCAQLVNITLKMKTTQINIDISTLEHRLKNGSYGLLPSNGT